MGTFASNVGLAVANLAAPAQGAVRRLRAAHRQDRLGERQPLHVPPAALDLHADRDAGAGGGEAEEEALGDRLSELRVRPVGRPRRSRSCSSRRSPTSSSSPSRRPPLGKIDAGAVVQALAEAKPDAIFSSLFAADLQKFVREGNTRGLFRNTRGVQPARRRARIPRSAQGRDARGLVGHRLSLERDQHAGAQGVPRRVPEALEGLPAPGLGGRLHRGATPWPRPSSKAKSRRHREAGRSAQGPGDADARSARSCGAPSTTSRPWAPMSASSRRRTARA